MARVMLGVQPEWLPLDLAALAGTTVPLFVSDYRLRRRKTLPRAAGPWALDSGAFSILERGSAFDAPAVYATRVRRYQEEIGRLDWVAPQDWMCEPWIIRKTGLTVEEHQRRTVHNFLSLRDLLGDLVIPVVQGWRVPGDYLRCVDLYDQAGVDLTGGRLVGLGSVCRRQATGQIALCASTLAARGLRLHGFRGEDGRAVRVRGHTRVLRLDGLVVPGSSARQVRARSHRVGGQLPGARRRLVAACRVHPRQPTARCAAAVRMTKEVA